MDAVIATVIAGGSDVVRPRPFPQSCGPRRSDAVGTGGNSLTCQPRHDELSVQAGTVRWRTAVDRLQLRRQVDHRPVPGWQIHRMSGRVKRFYMYYAGEHAKVWGIGQKTINLAVMGQPTRR